MNLRKEYMHILILLLTLGCTSVSVSPVPDKQSDDVYVYRFLSHGDRLVLDMQREAVFFDDVGIEADYCKPQSEYHCVRSELFSFAVPRNLTKERERWELNEKTYWVSQPPIKRDWFGERLTIAVIHLTEFEHNDNKTTDFYYSLERGLLALQIDPGKADAAWVTLQSTVGFGAMDK